MSSYATCAASGGLSRASCGCIPTSPWYSVLPGRELQLCGPAIRFIGGNREGRQFVLSVGQGEAEAEGPVGPELDGASADGDLRVGFRRAVKDQLGVDVEPETLSCPARRRQTGWSRLEKLEMPPMGDVAQRKLRHRHARTFPAAIAAG